MLWWLKNLNIWCVGDGQGRILLLMHIHGVPLLRGQCVTQIKDVCSHKHRDVQADGHSSLHFTKGWIRLQITNLVASFYPHSWVLTPAANYRHDSSKSVAEVRAKAGKSGIPWEQMVVRSWYFPTFKKSEPIYAQHVNALHVVALL